MKKGLKIVSVLMLILGILTVVTGVLNIGLLQNAGSGMLVDTLIGLTVILLVAGGLLDVISGLLALLAAGASAAMEPGVQSICACVVPALYFICAVSVKSRG